MVSGIKDGISKTNKFCNGQQFQYFVQLSGRFFVLFPKIFFLNFSHLTATGRKILYTNILLTNYNSLAKPPAGAVEKEEQEILSILVKSELVALFSDG